MTHEPTNGRYLVARCGDGFFLIEHHRIRRIVGQADVTPVPVPLPGLIGLSRFGGEPIAVFSPAVLSETGDTDCRGTVLVVEYDEDGRKRRIGLAVSEVVEFFSEGELESWRTRQPNGPEVKLQPFDFRTLEQPVEPLGDSDEDKER